MQCPSLRSAGSPAESSRCRMNARSWFRQFAVRGVFWRRYLDFGVTNVPIYLRAVMIVSLDLLFFLFRRARPPRDPAESRGHSPGLLSPNELRARLADALHFAWTIADAADHKLAQTEFVYAVEGEENLEELAAARGRDPAHRAHGKLRSRRGAFCPALPARDPHGARAGGGRGDRAASRRFARAAAAGAVKVAYNTSAHGAAARTAQRPARGRDRFHPGRSRDRRRLAARGAAFWRSR